jgi:hypothetical protein
MINDLLVMDIPFVHVHVPAGILMVSPLVALLIAVCTSVSLQLNALMMPDANVVALALVEVAETVPTPL